MLNKASALAKLAYGGRIFIPKAIRKYYGGAEFVSAPPEKKNQMPTGGGIYSPPPVSGHPDTTPDTGSAAPPTSGIAPNPSLGGTTRTPIGGAYMSRINDFLRKHGPSPKPPMNLQKYLEDMGAPNDRFGKWRPYKYRTRDFRAKPPDQQHVKYL